MHGLLKINPRRRQRTSARRHYRKHRRDNAPARAFAGAKLWMRQPVMPSTQAEAARLVGSTPVYVAAAATVIDAATPGLIEDVLHGRVPLLAAAESVRKRAQLLKAWREARPSDLKAFGEIVGVDRIFDDAIAPLL
jgi:hypothetical protein